MKTQTSHMGNRLVKWTAALAVALCLMTSGRAYAQFFMIDDDEYYGNKRSSVPGGSLVPIGPQGVTYDWIEDPAPLGDGVLVLLGFGGSYLLKKRKKKVAR